MAHQTLLGVTGSGKSIGYDDEVYIVEHCEGQSRASLVRAGPFIDRLMAEHGAAKVGGGDTESYGCVDRAFSTHAFDVRRGVAGLHRVGAFLRHRAPDRMYELETRCGRAVTLTGDHNLWGIKVYQFIRLGLYHSGSADGWRVGGKLERCRIPAALPLSDKVLRLFGYYIAEGIAAAVRRAVQPSSGAASAH
ncbi:MAG: hypothetical protein IPJ97_19765 [Proteobacteria bacterium]|nr:hypothetical protein [Pseudomonadota bacterium]